MASTIKTSRTSVENVHRFPEWSISMNYPMGSFIMDRDSDGAIRFFVAIEDVPQGHQKPHFNIADVTNTNYWVEAFNADSRQLSNTLVNLTENLSALFDLSKYDSEIKRIANNIDGMNSTLIPLTIKVDRIDLDIDSDFNTLSNNDSDLFDLLGQEEADRQTTKDEILDYIDETLGKKSSFDSDITSLLDSEITDRIAKYSILNKNVTDFDSDLTIKKDIDSDILAAVQRGDYYISPEQYDIIYNLVYDEAKEQYDSDIEYIIENNFKRYVVVDSEFVDDLEDRYQTYLDTKEADFQTTDIIEELRTRAGNHKFAQNAGLASGTAVGLISFGEARTEDFVTIEYTAVHTPNTGNKIIQTGKLAFNLPYNIPDDYTFTHEQLLKQTLNVATGGTDLITNFVLKTEAGDYTLYGDINYTSTDGTTVSGRMTTV